MISAETDWRGYIGEAASFEMAATKAGKTQKEHCFLCGLPVPPQCSGIDFGGGQELHGFPKELSVSDII